MQPIFAAVRQDGKFFELLKTDPRFEASGLEIPGRFGVVPDVRPEGDRLSQKNVIAAYRAVGRPMDKFRMSRMCRKYRAPSPRHGIGTLKAAGILASVLDAVYGIDVEPQELIG